MAISERTRAALANPSLYERAVWEWLTLHRGWPARESASLGTQATTGLVLAWMELDRLEIGAAGRRLDEVYGRTMRAGGWL